mgnify:CR=1 FL=1
MLFGHNLIELSSLNATIVNRDLHHVNVRSYRDEVLHLDLSFVIPGLLQANQKLNTLNGAHASGKSVLCAGLSELLGAKHYNVMRPTIAPLPPKFFGSKYQDELEEIQIRHLRDQRNKAKEKFGHDIRRIKADCVILDDFDNALVLYNFIDELLHVLNTARGVKKFILVSATSDALHEHVCFKSLSKLLPPVAVIDSELWTKLLRFESSNVKHFRNTHRTPKLQRI